MEILDVTDRLVVDKRAMGEWCRLPYPDHPKGCPNYGKKLTCPPQAPFILDWMGDSSKWYFVCIPFDLANQIEIMLSKHPHWSLRQARCLLYWQPKVNKELREVTEDFSRKVGYDPKWNYCPEAMGVNVMETARLQGLPIEIKPVKMVYKISLVLG